MANFELTVPAMGEGIIEVTLIRWFVKVGDKVEQDQPLVEIATDKVDSEVSAPVSGTLSRIFYHEGEVPQIGQVLAILSNEEEAGAVPTEHLDEIVHRTPELKMPVPGYLKQTALPDEETILTPYIRFLARDRDITLTELKALSREVKGQKITRDDLNQYIANGRPFRNSSITRSPGSEISVADGFVYQPGEQDRVVEMDRTRRYIARHMVQSKRISPHVTSAVEVDVTALVNWRELHKDSFYRKNGIKLTYTPLIVQAVVSALKKFPGINISVVGESVVHKKDINIGIATALPDGNLIVPVIKNADRYHWESLASQLAELTHRAKNKELRSDEVRGGTFSITNMGPYNNVWGTPIINQPEAAILAVGAIQKKPGVVFMDGQPTIGVRDLVVLSLTYDHRAIDGAMGGAFLNQIGNNLESMVAEIQSTSG